MKPNRRLAADAIQIMAMILKECGVPKDRLMAAIEYALRDLK